MRTTLQGTCCSGVYDTNDEDALMYRTAVARRFPTSCEMGRSFMDGAGGLAARGRHLRHKATASAEPPTATAPQSSFLPNPICKSVSFTLTEERETPEPRWEVCEFDSSVHAAVRP